MADTAEKYADRVSPEHKMAMDMVTSAYHTINIVIAHLIQLDEAERHSHSIAHIVDPTMYHDQICSKSFAQQMKIVRAAIAFQKAVTEAANG